MKFINASVQRIPHPDPNDTMGVYQYLEKIGRTCYKSEDKITDESCLKFLQNIFNRKHWAMLEHYPFVIADSDGSLYEALRACYTIDDIGVQSKLPYIRSNMLWTGNKSCIFISGSATGFNYLYEALMASPVDLADENVTAYAYFMRRMHLQFPKIFTNPECLTDCSDFNDSIDRERWELWSQEQVMELDDPNAATHLYMTARFVCDRGVTHEIVRHRPASYAQESTRYCNYGGSGCQFIIPEWFNDEERLYLRDAAPIRLYDDVVFDAKPRAFREGAWLWVKTMHIIDQTYAQLVNTDRHNWQPQQARSILPNGVKTEIVMTANIPEWGHFFNMRVPKSAHPQMREVAIPLYYLSRDMYGDRLPNLDDQAEGVPKQIG